MSRPSPTVSKVFKKIRHQKKESLEETRQINFIPIANKQTSYSREECKRSINSDTKNAKCDQGTFVISGFDTSRVWGVEAGMVPAGAWINWPPLEFPYYRWHIQPLKP